MERRGHGWLAQGVGQSVLAVLAVACGQTAEERGPSGEGSSTWSQGSSTSGGTSSSGGSSGTSSGGSGAAPTRPPTTASRRDAGVAEACEDLPREAATLYQSADDSNSMASPVVARHALEQGMLPSAGLLRAYEFMNYYGVRYPSPAPGSVRVVPQLVEGEVPGSLVLQVGVQAETGWQKRPVNLTFVLDTSGSMSGTPLGILKASVRAIASQLAAGDIVSVVIWNTAQNTLLESHVVDGANDDRLLSVVNAMQADGSTDLDSGLARGYELAQRNFSPDRLNRVVLISDGWANVGVTTAELIATQSRAGDAEGIYLVGISVGDAPNLTLMDVVTDMGFLSDRYAVEAARVLAPRFSEVMEVAARDVRLEVTLPWYLRLEEFHGEESSTVAEEIEPQHLAPGQAMVFAQTLQACDASQVVQGDTLTFRVTYKSPRTLEDREEAVATSVSSLLAGDHAQLDKGAAIVAYVEALQAAASLPALERTPILQAAKATVESANPGDVDADLTEIAGLLDLALAI